MKNTTITASALIHTVSEQQPLIIDVRTPAEVEKNFFPGAVNIPVNELTIEKVKAVIEKRQSLNTHIYLLCQSGKRAETAASILADLSDVIPVIISGGMNSINETAKSDTSVKNVMSIERQVRITAGAIVAASVAGGVFISSVFFALAAFVGLGLMFSGITNTCGMGLILLKAPWNK